MKNKTAFLLVVYPGVENYLDSCLRSLEEQTVAGFDVVIINDNFQNLDMLKEYKSLSINVFNFSGTVSKIREFGISKVIEEGYEFLVFGDADDYFSSDRIEQSIKHLKNNNIVVNDVSLINEDDNLLEDKYFSHRVNNNQLLDEKFIIDKNIFGLSNTAINVDILKEVKFNSKLKSVDWFLFGKLLIEGNKAIFTNEALTYYRQHHSNYIGINHLNEEKILRGLSVKTLHYDELRKIKTDYNNSYLQAKKIYERMQEDTGFKEKYISIIMNSRINHPFWWEEIKTAEYVNE